MQLFTAAVNVVACSFFLSWAFDKCLALFASRSWF